MTTTARRSHTDRHPSTPRHTRRTETTERPTGGHTFGQDLSATDRAALLGWLRTLE